MYYLPLPSWENQFYLARIKSNTPIKLNPNVHTRSTILFTGFWDEERKPMKAGESNRKCIFGNQFMKPMMFWWLLGVEIGTASLITEDEEQVTASLCAGITKTAWGCLHTASQLQAVPAPVKLGPWAILLGSSLIGGMGRVSGVAAATGVPLC